MDAQQMKQAIIDNSPVVYNETVYIRINAIIYRRIKNEIFLHAELLDRSGHSITIAPADKIEALPEEMIN